MTMCFLSETLDSMLFPSKSSGLPARWKKPLSYVLYQLEFLMLFLKKTIVASSVCKKISFWGFPPDTTFFWQLMVSNRDSQQGVAGNA